MCVPSSWETVHFRQSVGEQQGDIPSFFNVSLLAALGVPSACVDASVCFSEGTHYFYSLGTRASCRYRYADRRVQFTYQYASGLQFGAGNVTITLVCGRTLVRESDISVATVLTGQALSSKPATLCTVACFVSTFSSSSSELCVSVCVCVCVCVCVV